ncbi:hypothetical protein [Dyella sp. OK004]|uniref:hypothetical protein n=1 Tax=Dyella sp. OK004 TaxID=1855292 RepID=UPI001C431AFF|nr:hypothetical protein [Dyella sp. OK004]
MIQRIAQAMHARLKAWTQRALLFFGAQIQMLDGHFDAADLDQQIVVRVQPFKIEVRVHCSIPLRVLQGRGSNRHATNVMEITLYPALHHGMTHSVISCPDPAQISVLVTQYSRSAGDYQPYDEAALAACATVHYGFWRPATRSSWIPPVPETAGRQISFQGTKNDGAHWAPSRFLSRHAIEPLSVRSQRASPRSVCP